LSKTNRSEFKASKYLTVKTEANEEEKSKVFANYGKML